MGVDEGILLHDAAFANADATSTAYVLAEAIKKLVRTSSSCVGVRRRIGTRRRCRQGSLSSSVCQCDCGTEGRGAGGRDPVQRLLEDGYEVLDVRPPCLVTISNEANKPRYPTLKGIMAAGKKKIPVWNTAELGVDPAHVGNAGARTKITKLYIPRFEGKCEFIEGETPEEMGEKLALRLRELKII